MRASCYKKNKPDFLSHMKALLLTCAPATMPPPVIRQPRRPLIRAKLSDLMSLFDLGLSAFKTVS